MCPKNGVFLKNGLQRSEPGLRFTNENSRACMTNIMPRYKQPIRVTTCKNRAANCGRSLLCRSESTRNSAFQPYCVWLADWPSRAQNKYGRLNKIPPLTADEINEILNA